MSRLAAPGQRSLHPPARGPAGGRNPMRTGTAISLITTGAILLFALVGTPHWLNLHVVGLILILTGGLGLLLPRLARDPLHPDRLRRWVRPGQPRAPRPAPPRPTPGSHDRPAQATTPGDSPTMLDDLLADERPLV